MVERAIPRKPEPDLLTKPFVEGIHPYTMMFLYLAYQEGAYKGFSKRQLEVFDRYYIDNLTIEGQYDYTTRGNMSTLIRMGFEALRRNVSDKVNEAFPDRLLPYFKEKDLPFIKDSKKERKKRGYANRSMTQKGRQRSKETKLKIGQTQTANWQIDEHRNKTLTRHQKATSKKSYRDNLSNSVTLLWQDETYKEKGLKNLEKAREALKKKLEEKANQQESE